MSRVLAFDFGASTGRAILAEYKNGKLSYNEVHRFDNNLVKKDGLLCWDFDYLLNEVKKAIDMCENVDSLAFDTWGKLFFSHAEFLRIGCQLLRG